MATINDEDFLAHYQFLTPDFRDVCPSEDYVRLGRAAVARVKSFLVSEYGSTVDLEYRIIDVSVPNGVGMVGIETLVNGEAKGAAQASWFFIDRQRYAESGMPDDETYGECSGSY